MILLDTAILIDYLREFVPAIDFFEKEYNMNKQTTFISVVTAIELINGARDKIDQNILESFINEFTILEIDGTISRLSLVLTKNYRLAHTISLPDSLIAATAIAQNALFLTRNVKDFDYIKGLKVQSPY